MQPKGHDRPLSAGSGWKMEIGAFGGNADVPPKSNCIKRLQCRGEETKIRTRSRHVMIASTPHNAAISAHYNGLKCARYKAISSRIANMGWPNPWRCARWSKLMTWLSEEVFGSYGTERLQESKNNKITHSSKRCLTARKIYKFAQLPNAQLPAERTKCARHTLYAQSTSKMIFYFWATGKLDLPVHHLCPGAHQCTSSTRGKTTSWDLKASREHFDILRAQQNRLHRGNNMHWKELSEAQFVVAP